jgi:aspartyl-tRNA(Asn)/glutamyl-tRNA(Gln) amidotransferase subunit A
VSDDIAYLSIAEAAKRIAARDLSPVDLTEAMIARSAAIDPALGSFVTRTDDVARAAARDAEAEIAAGRYRGPLHGIPIALKEAFDTAGIRTTVGSKLLRDNVPVTDATAWERLRDAGAVLLGKLETTEFCYGGPSDDSLFKPARNPWGADRYAGGSSSGAGVSLASGQAMGALGTDTGGSIRLPAAYCGITGLMPSYGLVSRAGVFPLSPTLDHVGPMARSVEDCAILLNALAGHDPRDAGSIARPATDYTATLAGGAKGLRVGLAGALSRDDAVSPEGIAAYHAAADTFRGLGADVREVELSSLEDFATAQIIITLVEGYAIHEKDLQDRRAEYSYHSRMRLSLGPFIRAVDYARALQLRETLIARYNETMAAFDVILAPGAPGAAPKAAGVGAFQFFRKPLVTMAANVLGVPALGVPAGISADGLPLAVQFMGKRFDDAVVLQAGAAFQAATDWHKARPTVG